MVSTISKEFKRENEFLGDGVDHLSGIQPRKRVPGRWRRPSPRKSNPKVNSWDMVLTISLEFSPVNEFLGDGVDHLPGIQNRQWIPG